MTALRRTDAIEALRIVCGLRVRELKLARTYGCLHSHAKVGPCVERQRKVRGSKNGEAAAHEIREINLRLTVRQLDGSANAVDSVEHEGRAGDLRFHRADVHRRAGNARVAALVGR
jgi:hypothetical protein